MALDLIDTYNGQVAEGDAGYPYGKAQNVNVEGDGTGTPWEEQIVNDWLGFYQALLLAAGVTPSGVSDTALSSQYLSAVQWIAEAAGATFNVKKKHGASNGAAGNGVADDTTAIQDAITAAAAAGGGTVFFPPGRYLHGLLTIPAGVSLRGVPDKTILLHNHATQNGLVFLSFSDANPAVIQDIRFLGSVAGTGTHVVNNSSARVQFIRCTWNGLGPGSIASNNLQGTLATVGAADSEIEFIDCRIKVAGALKGLNAADGKIRVVRGSLVMPQSYAEALVYAGGSSDVELSNVHVDCSLHTGGTAFVFMVPNTTARGRMLGCKFNGQVGSTTYGFWWEEGALVVSRNNDWSNRSAFFAPFANNRSASGSQVDMLPLFAWDAVSAPAIDSGILGSRARYTNVNIKNNSTSPTTIDLQQGIVPGQILHFTYFAVSTQSISFVGTPLTASALPGSGTLTAGSTLTGTFVWESRDINTSYRWVQKGTWGVGLTLV